MWSLEEGSLAAQNSNWNLRRWGIGNVRVPPVGGLQYRGVTAKTALVQGTLSWGRKILPQSNDQRDHQ